MRENRLRRMAERQGVRLVKSRRRDPRALGYGTYNLLDERTEALVLPDPAGTGFGASLDDVEAWLTRTE